MLDICLQQHKIAFGSSSLTATLVQFIEELYRFAELINPSRHNSMYWCTPAHKEQDFIAGGQSPGEEGRYRCFAARQQEVCLAFAPPIQVITLRLQSNSGLHRPTSPGAFTRGRGCPRMLGTSSSLLED